MLLNVYYFISPNLDSIYAEVRNDRVAPWAASLLFSLSISSRSKDHGVSFHSASYSMKANSGLPQLRFIRFSALIILIILITLLPLLNPVSSSLCLSKY